VNASRTIQQVKANLREIEKTRKQVEEHDLEVFDEKIKNMKDGSLKAVREFVDLYQGTKTGTNT